MPRERDAFVAASCGDDARLRHEVESMLAAHDAARQFGDTPAFADARASTAIHPLTALALARGTRVGPYETLSCSAWAGWVWSIAPRTRRLHRDVALKVLLPSFAEDPDRLARFSAKRACSPR